MGIFKNRNHTYVGYEKKVRTSHRVFDIKETVDYLKKNPYDNSSKDLVYLYENAKNAEQKDFVCTILKSYVRVEADVEITEIYDYEDWDMLETGILSTSCTKYDIPYSTKAKINEARKRLEKSVLEDLEKDKLKELNRQKEYEDKFDELF